MPATTKLPSAGAVQVGAGALRYQVDERWTIPCDRGYGEIIGVACDSQQRVYLFARGTRTVHVFEADGTPRQSWDARMFVRPHGIFIGRDDAIYCTDDFDHTVRVFAPDGTPRFTLGKSGTPSDTGVNGMDYRTIRRAAAPFNFPTNLALAPDGDLYVTDGYGNCCIHRFSPTGQLRQSWGEPGDRPGQFHLPHGIAIDATGLVYVADRENSRIQRFTADGAFVDEWRDVARPCQVFIDRAGVVYVAELGFHAARWPGSAEPGRDDSGGRVSIFDREGRLLARWGGGKQPTAAGDFLAPHDVWVDGQGDVYIAEVTLSGGGNDGVVPLSCHTLQKFTLLGKP